MQKKIFIKYIILIGQVFSFLFFSSLSFGETFVFQRNFGLGSRGEDVLNLQKLLNLDSETRVAISGIGSPGQETGSFGYLTRDAVIKFQKKYIKDILLTNQVPTGYVGPKTLKQLNKLAKAKTVVDNRTKTNNVSSQLPLPSVVSRAPSVQLRTPAIISVYPDRVRQGDTVTVSGENFSSTGNTVRLRFGQIEDTFYNLPSVDGKTISFTYQPPDVKTMTKDEILALPPQTLSAILNPIKAAGGSIDDIVAPYRSIKNERDFKTFLNRNGHSLDELYDKFYITVENIYGVGTSRTVALWGLRKLQFGMSLSDNDSFFSIISSLFESFTPKAHAQGTAEGGINSGIIMYCTCADGYLTFMMDYSQNGGSGLYYWSSSFQATTGNPMMSGPHLGFFIQNAGICVVGVEPYCAEVSANIASLPWGEAPVGGN
ncbi:MAG: peptidoglycan-binding protein [Candidatus Taylorbacteria bacterium]|nr:peptidoglycan-binding protein [Candidatus Taylorbacteria bacterium]